MPFIIARSAFTFRNIDEHWEQVNDIMSPVFPKKSSRLMLTLVLLVVTSLITAPSVAGDITLLKTPPKTALLGETQIITGVVGGSAGGSVWMVVYGPKEKVVQTESIPVQSGGFFSMFWATDHLTEGGRYAIKLLYTQSQTSIEIYLNQHDEISVIHKMSDAEDAIIKQHNFKPRVLNEAAREKFYEAQDHLIQAQEHYDNNYHDLAYNYSEQAEALAQEAYSIEAEYRRDVLQDPLNIVGAGILAVIVLGVLIFYAKRLTRR